MVDNTVNQIENVIAKTNINDEEIRKFLQCYNNLNSSFDKKCVFSVGTIAGFFSEINNMIWAMIYCASNNIKFLLYSQNANFSNLAGWQEFFEPFCDEFYSKIPKKFNKRTDEDVKGLAKNGPFRFIWFFFEKKHKIAYFTHDIWDDFFNNGLFSRKVKIEALEIEGDYILAGKKFAKMIWRFNDSTKIEVKKIIDRINLPKQYVSIHLRAGDKIAETTRVGAKLIGEEIFMEKIKQRSILKNVFVFADDYRQIETLKNNYPDFNFYTLCNEDERGYDNGEFQSLTWNEKRPKLLNLFANMEICLRLDYFIGSMQANPDLFGAMYMESQKVEILPYM